MESLTLEPCTDGPLKMKCHKTFLFSTDGEGVFLGSGSYGDVFLGYCSERKRHVAVKQFRPHIGSQDDSTKATSVSGQKEQEIKPSKELNILTLMKSENIVDLYGYATCDKRMVLFLEYCDLGHLGEFYSGYEVTEQVTIELMVQIANGVRAVHSFSMQGATKGGYVHRDIKPNNILVTTTSSLLPRPLVKLADFGLCSMIEDFTGESFASTSKTGHAAGTLHYMAPEAEIYAKKKPSNPKAFDIFSTGLVFVGMLQYPERHTMKIAEAIEGVDSYGHALHLQHTLMKTHESDHRLKHPMSPLKDNPSKAYEHAATVAREMILFNPTARPDSEDVHSKLMDIFVATGYMQIKAKQEHTILSRFEEASTQLNRTESGADAAPADSASDAAPADGASESRGAVIEDVFPISADDESIGTSGDPGPGNLVDATFTGTYMHTEGSDSGGSSSATGNSPGDGYITQKRGHSTGNQVASSESSDVSAVADALVDAVADDTAYVFPADVEMTSHTRTDLDVVAETPNARVTSSTGLTERFSSMLRPPINLNQDDHTFGQEIPTDLAAALTPSLDIFQATDVMRVQFLGGLTEQWQQTLWDILTNKKYRHGNDSDHDDPTDKLNSVKNKMFIIADLTTRALTACCSTAPKLAAVQSICENVLVEDELNLVALSILALVHHQLGDAEAADTFLQQTQVPSTSTDNVYRRPAVAGLSMIYFRKRYDILAYPDFIWDLHAIRVDPNLKQDKDILSFANYHYGLFIYRVVNLQHWRDAQTFEKQVCRDRVPPEKLMRSARDALEAASGPGNQGYQARCLVTIAELNDCLSRKDSPAPPILEEKSKVAKLLDRAIKRAQDEKDANSLGRIGKLFLFRKQPAVGQAEDVLRKSLDISVTLPALTTMFSLQYERWLQEYLEENPSLMEIERNRLSEPKTNVKRLSRKLADLCYTPQDANFLSKESRAKLLTLLSQFMYDLKRHTKLGRSYATQLSVLLGKTTMDKADSEFEEAIRQCVTKKGKGWVYLRWSGCYRALRTDRFHHRYRELLWEAVRLLPQKKYPSAAATALLHVISSERGDAEIGSEKLNIYYREKAALYLLMGKQREAWLLLDEATTHYPTDETLSELLSERPSP